MSVSWIQDYQRDPRAYIRKQFAALSERNERECAEAARAAEQDRYRAAYAERHKPEPPSAA